MTTLVRAFLVLSLVELVNSPALMHAAPPEERWLEHLNNDLLPFWTTESALGKPIGAFPSVRCNDRTLFDARRPCPEVASDSVHQRFLVALSRQTYGYGVAFHLTGRRVYLDYMKAGIDYIRQNALDRLNGGMATTLDLRKDRWGPTPELRTAQQLAYGLLGMAFYYYLTRDAGVLQDIIAVKTYIFAKYATPSGRLRWQLPNRSTHDSKNLVAQLDQMNSYLVLLTPILPEPTQSEWKQSLTQLANVMIKEFYSPTDKLFFNDANQPSNISLATSGTDFGHNAKALWMIRWTGLITGNVDLLTFANDNAQPLLSRAYIMSCGCWAGGVLAGGTLDLNKLWWVYAELDQLAGTLALVEPSYARYLGSAYNYWFTYFIDKQYGEVWSAVDGKTHAPQRQSPKQWEWKNAYHSFEHALVGYIVAQQLNDVPVALYYAFSSDAQAKFARPYFYSGAIRRVESVKDGEGPPFQRVTFENVR
jgi:mannose/cellobiose epimerase-like protein (N-acyl-D-glucosamine 2-epimerase family)